MMKRTLIALAVILAAGSAFGQQYGRTVLYGDLELRAWSAVSNLTATATNGTLSGTYYYRVSGTNIAGRIPATAATNVTCSTNGVRLQWKRKDGLFAYVVERSGDGATWTNWSALSPSVTNYTDAGTNAWAGTVFTNLYAAIPQPGVVGGGILTTGMVSTGLAIVDGMLVTTGEAVSAVAFVAITGEPTDNAALAAWGAGLGGTDAVARAGVEINSNNLAVLQSVAVTNNQTGVTLGLAAGTTISDATSSNHPVSLYQLQEAASIYKTWQLWSGSNSSVMADAKAMRLINEGNPPAGTNTITVNSNAQYITYCSLPANLTSLKAGLYQVNVTAWQSASGVDAVSLSAEIYIRNTNGTETELTAVSGTEAQSIGATALEYIFTVNITNNAAMVVTDSVLLKFKTSATAGTPVTLYITHGYLSVPIPSSQFVLNNAAGIAAAGGLTNAAAFEAAGTVAALSNSLGSAAFAATDQFAVAGAYLTNTALDHAGLSNLTYSASGHSGFQAELYTPESHFAFDGLGTITAYLSTNAAVRVPPVIGGVPVTSIGTNVFDGNVFTSLTKVTIPNGVTNIGSRAFLNTYLYTLELPDSITIIGSDIFGVSGLQAIYLRGNPPAYDPANPPFQAPYPAVYVEAGRGYSNTYAGATVTLWGQVCATNIAGANAGATAYQKPAGGITSNDIAAATDAAYRSAGSSPTLDQLGGVTNTAAGIAAAGGVTNGGATVNGSAVTNGAAITIAGGGTLTNINVGGIVGTVVDGVASVAGVATNIAGANAGAIAVTPAQLGTATNTTYNAATNAAIQNILARGFVTNASGIAASNITALIANGTATLTRAMGRAVYVAGGAPLTITVQSADWASTDFGTFALGVFSTGSVTFLPATMTNTQTSWSTTATNNIIFFKGLGTTVWTGR